MSDKEKAPKKALGKGLNSLLGDFDDAPAGGKSAGTGAKPVLSESDTRRLADKMILRVSPDDIEANPHQPRKVFRQEDLISLSNSLKIDGVVQPLIVSRSEKAGKYTLIAGERRWRASKMAGLQTVPVILKEVTSDDMLRIALIENIQRADLNVIEEAHAFASLINDFGLTQEQCSKKVGKERATVTNTLRLLTLPKEIQDDLLEERLSMGHGRALLSLEDKKLMLRARDIVVKKQLSVRQTEQLCKRIKKGDSPEKAASPIRASADLDYLAETLRSHLRTKVKLSGSGARGKIEISYFSASELERILGLIGSNQL